MQPESMPCSHYDVALYKNESLNNLDSEWVGAALTVPRSNGSSKSLRGHAHEEGQERTSMAEQRGSIGWGGGAQVRASLLAAQRGVVFYATCRSSQTVCGALTVPMSALLVATPGSMDGEKSGPRSCSRLLATGKPDPQRCYLHYP